MITPNLQEFKQLAQRHNVIPLSRETLVDRITPVSAYERLRKGEKYSFLLESVEGGERFGRYTFVGQRPQAVFVSRGDSVSFTQGGRTRKWNTTNPVKDLKEIFDKISAAETPGLPRFWGGAVGYWNYETAGFFERLPKPKKDMLGFPTGAFQLTGELVVFDRLAQTARIITNVHIPEGKRSPKDLEKLYKQGLQSIERQLKRIHDRSSLPKARKAGVPGKPRPLMKKQDFMKSVEQAKEYIRSGDIIQVVLSQRWELEPKADSFDVYRALRVVNPSPYMYYIQFPELDMVGSSPEILVRKENDLAETRPIAGTRHRGATAEEDIFLAEELRKDPKERAEHLMLVDLGRNDLGRVCQPGSVKVPELMTIENYSHVMHIVSSVTGKLSPNANSFDLFQACFPAGTVSGAPKIRAMQIINELESMARGPYAGAVGYFSYNGNMDMAITIRTLVFSKGKAYMQAGAGIVADSDPESEHRECEHKAAAVFAAVERTRELS